MFRAMGQVGKWKYWEVRIGSPLAPGLGVVIFFFFFLFTIERLTKVGRWQHLIRRPLRRYKINNFQNWSFRFASDFLNLCGSTSSLPIFYAQLMYIPLRQLSEFLRASILYKYHESLLNCFKTEKNTVASTSIMRSLTVNSYNCLLLLLLTACGIMGQFDDFDRSDTSVCINMYECDPIMDMLNNAKKPLSQSIIQHIRNIHCGYDGTEGKVWCEQQTDETRSQDPPDVSNHVNLNLINPSSCGPAMEQKIHGGTKTGIFDYPWMALLAYRTAGSRKLKFQCGGTVINQRYILTAAHCVVNSSGILESIRVGEHNINTERDCIFTERGEEHICADKYQDINIASIHSHPKYVPGNTANDIALVRLSTKIDFRPRNVKPICLPVGSAVTPASKKMIVTGWGTTESGTQSDVLLQISIPQVSNEHCTKIYEVWTQISHKQLCAGGKSGIGTCTGDSGGPLQALARYRSTTKYVQYGIVSFAVDLCAHGGFPGVYTNVKYYMDWILNTISP